MNIAIDASRANRVNKTGVEWYAFHVIREMLKLADKQDQFSLYMQEQLREDWGVLPSNADVKVLDWKIRYMWTHLCLGPQLAKKVPDVTFIPAHVIPVVHKKPIVMTFHDIAFKKFPQSYSWKENAYQEFAMKYALKHAAKIIVPTETTRQDIITYYNTGHDKLVVVNHGFDNLYELPTSKSNSEDLEEHVTQKYGITSPYILFVGRIEEKKNIIRMIKAFELVKEHNHDLQFVLIGKPGFGYEKIQAYIKQSSVANDIIQPGWVEQSDMPVIFRNAEIFFYATLYEGFGLPILEAFASGVPVVTTEYGASKEIAGDGAVLVDPLDYKLMADKIIGLLANEQKRCSLLAAAKKELQKYSWQKCAQETYNVLKSLQSSDIQN